MSLLDVLPRRRRRVVHEPLSPEAAEELRKVRLRAALAARDRDVAKAQAHDALRQKAAALAGRRTRTRARA